MAEEETSVASNGGNSWWNSWMNTAKTKSAEVFEFVKRDLDEFSSAVKQEATAVVANTTSAFKETLQLDKPESTVSNVKRSFSSFLGQVSNALSPPPDDGDEEAILIQGDSPILLTRLQTRLYNIYNDTNTFTKEIEDEHDAAFEAWLANLDEHHLSNERLTRLLGANPVLQHNYEMLVPHQVSHAQFWKRLLFRKAMVEDEEAARERREERDRIAAETFQWDQENTKKEDDINLSVREKKDLVIVSAEHNSSSTSTSTGDKG
ncbi:BSD domain-containing protein 1-like isoform X2 [Lycorma delicatula]|uniref:BSD domain-containing protein 1-like isoform X2 n=1 Tax=Lycorma delicatula TaxID=130591 RepID=UPI003F51A6C4